MNRIHSSTPLEDALRAELQAAPSPAAAASIDRRVSAALAQSSTASEGTTRRLRQLTIAPMVAVVAALVLGTVVAAAALVLTAEDQRVFDLIACMENRGWEVANPNVEAGSNHVVPGFSTIVDPSQQQAFNADLEDCATEVGIPFER